MYSIKIIPQAQKDLDKIPAKIFPKIKEEILKLEQNPRAHGAIKLTAEQGYRLRVGDYRILYRIDDVLKTVYLYRVKHRKDVYR